MGNRLTLSREGRSNLEAYLARQAELAETTVERLGKTFSVDPAVHQKME
ncbi:capsid protein, partial [Escherichia coli]